MNRDEQIEFIRKRNAELNAQLEELKDKLIEAEGTGIILEDTHLEEFQELEEEYRLNIDDLKKTRDGYERLLKDLQDIKGTFLAKLKP